MKSYTRNHAANWSLKSLSSGKRFIFNDAYLRSVSRNFLGFPQIIRGLEVDFWRVVESPVYVAHEFVVTLPFVIGIVFKDLPKANLIVFVNIVAHLPVVDMKNVTFRGLLYS